MASIRALGGYTRGPLPSCKYTVHVNGMEFTCAQLVETPEKNLVRVPEYPAIATAPSAIAQALSVNQTIILETPGGTYRGNGPLLVSQVLHDGIPELHLKLHGGDPEAVITFTALIRISSIRKLRHRIERGILPQGEQESGGAQVMLVTPDVFNTPCVGNMTHRALRRLIRRLHRWSIDSSQDTLGLVVIKIKGAVM